jgi:hypothetical protein
VGQAYLDEVMKYDAALQGKLAALRMATAPEALWPRTDPRWQKQVELDKAIEDLEKLVESKPAASPAASRAASQAVSLPVRPAVPRAAEPAALSPAQLLSAMDEAIGKVPAGLTLRSDGSRLDFFNRVWEALEVDGTPLRDYVAALEQRARVRLEFCRRVVASRAELDPARGGLHVKDTARQRQLDAPYEALASLLEAPRQAFLAHAEKRWRYLAAVLKTIDKREERSDYNLLSSERKYLKDNLEAVLKSLEQQCSQAEARRDELQQQLGRAGSDEKKKLESQVADQNAVVQEFRAQCDAWKTRIYQLPGLVPSGGKGTGSGGQ